jgi:hypothetical protein
MRRGYAAHGECMTVKDRSAEMPRVYARQDLVITRG